MSHRRETCDGQVYYRVKKIRAKVIGKRRRRIICGYPVSALLMLIDGYSRKSSNRILTARCGDQGRMLPSFRNTSKAGYYDIVADAKRWVGEV